MKIPTLVVVGLVLAACTATPLQKQAENGGHDMNAAHHKKAIGKPGQLAEATRTVDIAMHERDDGAMVFEPASITVKQGETIRFAVANAGELEHEFVLDDREGILKHKALMEKFPEMEHDDPNSVRLEPGKKGDVIWTFSNSGELEFACLVPGHYDAGMKGDLMVVSALAMN